MLDSLSMLKRLYEHENTAMEWLREAISKTIAEREQTRKQIIALKQRRLGGCRICGKRPAGPRFNHLCKRHRVPA